MQNTTPRALKARFAQVIAAISLSRITGKPVEWKYAGKGIEPTSLRQFKLEMSTPKDVDGGLYSQGEQFTIECHVVTGYRDFDEDEETYISNDAIDVRHVLCDLVGVEPGLVAVRLLGSDPDASGDVVRHRFKVDYMHNTGILGTEE